MVNMPAAVRDTSAGVLNNGGSASVAIKVIAVVTPIDAEHTISHNVDGMNISPRNDTNRIGPKIRNGQAWRCMRFAIVSKMIGVTICAPLSQAKAGPSSSGLPWLVRKSPRKALVEKYAALLLPRATPSSQTSGLFQSGHHSPPIAALVTCPLPSLPRRRGRVGWGTFGLKTKNAGAISSAATAQATRSRRQLPPTRGRTTGMVKTVPHIAPISMPLE